MSEKTILGARRPVHVFLPPSKLPREAGLTARPTLVVHDSDDVVARGANVETKAVLKDFMKC